MGLAEEDASPGGASRKQEQGEEEEEAGEPLWLGGRVAQVLLTTLVPQNIGA